MLLYYKCSLSLFETFKSYSGAGINSFIDSDFQDKTRDFPSRNHNLQAWEEMSESNSYVEYQLKKVSQKPERETQIKTQFKKWDEDHPQEEHINTIINTCSTFIIKVFF